MLPWVFPEKVTLNIYYTDEEIVKCDVQMR